MRVFQERPWLFGKRVDLLAFGGSAAASLGLLAVGAWAGLLNADTPEWLSVVAVSLKNVAHVWSTLFRVYLDPVELRRRLGLYLALPALCYAVGVALHSVSSMTFWRVLAYLALFHFIRQQQGWLKLYQRRAPSSTNDHRLESATLYLSMVFPVVHWHAHLPRRFSWFMQGDFVHVADAWMRTLTQVVGGVYALLALLWLARLALRVRAGTAHPGVVLLLSTTAACWGAGIVLTNGDFAFTATNVLIHGIPYVVLTLRYGLARAPAVPGSALSLSLRWGAAGGLLLLLLLAFGEELLWDWFVWHERSWLFGDGLRRVDLSPALLSWLVPLLSLPQTTHYALDGLVWRKRGNPGLGAVLEP